MVRDFSPPTHISTELRVHGQLESLILTKARGKKKKRQGCSDSCKKPQTRWQFSSACHGNQCQWQEKEKTALPRLMQKASSSMAVFVCLSRQLKPASRGGWSLFIPSDWGYVSLWPFAVRAFVRQLPGTQARHHLSAACDNSSNNVHSVRTAMNRQRLILWVWGCVGARRFSPPTADRRDDPTGGLSHHQSSVAGTGRKSVRLAAAASYRFRQRHRAARKLSKPAKLKRHAAGGPAVSTSVRSSTCNGHTGHGAGTTEQWWKKLIFTMSSTSGRDISLRCRCHWEAPDVALCLLRLFSACRHVNRPAIGTVGIWRRHRWRESKAQPKRRMR